MASKVFIQLSFWKEYFKRLYEMQLSINNLDTRQLTLQFFSRKA
jgi:hypothetical protein